MTSLHADEAFLAHYQLSQDPFAARPAGFRFFPAQRKPVLGQLHHLARYSQLLLVVTGPLGAGKTLLRQALVASTNKQSVQSVVASARSGADAPSVLRQLAQGLGAQPDLRSLLAQVEQLALTGQEVYLLIDDAELLADSALQMLIQLAAGGSAAHPHIFLFSEPTLPGRLAALGGGDECFHTVELQAYSEEETRDYLAQRLEGAGQGIELFDDEQIADIHRASAGWPGAINLQARELLVEQMLSRQSHRARPAAGGLPKKHLLALLVVGVALAAAWFMQGRTGGQEPAAERVVDLLPQPLPVPASPAAALPEAPVSSSGNGPQVEFSGVSQPLPLPLGGDAQPVIREPLAQASGMQDGEDSLAAGQAAMASPEPVVQSIPQPVVPTIASTPAPAPVPTAVPAPVTRPVAAPAPPPAPVVAAPAPARSTAPVAAAATGTAWYRSRPAGQYALQVFGTRSESSAKAFVSQHGSEYHYFRKLHQGQSLYVVTYGQFSSRQAAQAAIAGLPAAARSSQPWPRSFASIQQELR